MPEIKTDLSSNIFRAYDIRGIVDQELSVDAVYTIGIALGNKAWEQQHTQFIIGRDGRLSGPALSAALTEGLRAAGCSVIDLGMVPTPLLYFATHFLKTGTGVMITGSHNPTQYNGLKMLIAGDILHTTSITELYQRISQNKLITREYGDYKTRDITADYLHAVLSRVKLARSFKIVADCGNGVTGQLAPLLLKKLGNEVIPLFCEIDGHFPNHHPDPMVPKNLKTLIETVKKEKADLGLAFDGDGDRLGVVTEHGDIIWPDRQLMLFAQDVLQRFPGATIVYDVKCTRLLKTLIEQNGGKPLMSATGHSLIKAAVKRVQAPLAGEMSGHIFFSDNWYGFDDALYCAARLLELLAKQNLTIGQLFDQFPKTVSTPELPITVTEEEKFTLIKKLQHQAHFPTAEIITIDGICANYPHGWGLIRASNTTPTLVTRFEADTPENLAWIQQQFKQQLLTLAPHLKLPF